MSKGHVALASRIPKCDFCEKPATMDGKTVLGPWAYMCNEHIQEYAIGKGQTGVGIGQKLTLKEVKK